MSLFAEIKRRNVFKVAIAYVLMAWVALQAADFALDLVDAPNWIIQVLFIIFAIGLPFALFFAWAFEVTPEGIRRDSGASHEDHGRPQTSSRLNQITMVSLVVLVAFLLVERFGGEAGSEPVEQGGPASLQADEAVQPWDGARASVAVMPFTNMSPDPDNEYFADGMSEELLNLLVKVDGLRVPSRTSSFAFKDQSLDIRQIAQQLGVDHVLEGSVRKAGNKVRITAQLIDVTTDTHLWSETYDRELEDIFAIQDEIATEIVTAMHVVLGTGIVDQRPTENLEAYTLYLQGRELFRQRSEPEVLTAARQLLQQAVALDAQFAQAWALLAMVEATIPGYAKEDFSRYEPTTIEFADKALALDSNLVEARLAVTQVLSARNEPGRALEQYSAIVQQSPRHSQARLWYAIDLYKVGYLTQAYEQISAAVDLDPIHPTMLDWYARIAIAVDRPQPGFEAAIRSIQLGRTMGVVAIVQYNLVYGTVAGVESYLERFPYFEGFRWVFATQADPAKLQEGLDWISENQSGSSAAYMVLDLYRVAGSVDEYYEQLDRIHLYDGTVDFTVWLPGSTSQRDGARFNAWAKRRGYDALWREQGPPDLCRLDESSTWICDSPEELGAAKEELGSEKKKEELGSE